MAWITAAPVEILLQTELEADAYIDGLIDHAQALAEMEVGAQADPSAALKAVLAQVVARMWQAGQNAKQNPAAMSMEVAGPFTFQTMTPGVAGLGLTDREKALLRKAVGASPFWVQPTYRNDTLETAPTDTEEQFIDATDPVDAWMLANADMVRPEGG